MLLIQKLLEIKENDEKHDKSHTHMKQQKIATLK